MSFLQSKTIKYLRKALLSGAAISLIAASYYTYSGFRRSTGSDHFWGISRNGKDVTLTSPISFCHVTEKWTQKDVPDEIKSSLVTVFNNEEENGSFKIETLPGSSQPHKLTVLTRFRELEIEFILSDPDTDCFWHEISVILRKQGQETIYTDSNNDMVLDQIQLSEWENAG